MSNKMKVDEGVELDLYYTGTQLSAMFKIDINTMSNCVSAHPVVSQYRQRLSKTNKNAAFYLRSDVDGWIESVGSIEACKKELMAARAALCRKGGAKYYDRKVVKRKPWKSDKPVVVVKRPTVVHVEAIGDLTRGETLNELMARIAAQPVRKYNSNEFGV